MCCSSFHPLLCVSTRWHVSPCLNISLPQSPLQPMHRPPNPTPPSSFFAQCCCAARLAHNPPCQCTCACAQHALPVLRFADACALAQRRLSASRTPPTLARSTPRPFSASRMPPTFVHMPSTLSVLRMYLRLRAIIPRSRPLLPSCTFPFNPFNPFPRFTK